MSGVRHPDADLDRELDRELRSLFDGAARPLPPASLEALLTDLPARPASTWRRALGRRPRFSGTALIRRGVAIAAVVLVVVGLVAAFPSLRLGSSGAGTGAPSAAGTEIAGGPSAAPPAASSAAAASAAATEAATSAASSAATSAPSASSAASASSGASGAIMSGDAALAIARSWAGGASGPLSLDATGLSATDPVYRVYGQGIEIRIAALTGRVRSYLDAAKAPAGAVSPLADEQARAAAEAFLIGRGVAVADLPSVGYSVDPATGANVVWWRAAGASEGSAGASAGVTVFVNPATRDVFRFADARP